MRQSEEHPLDPEVIAELEAIDATLAGEPVDPSYAELAELSLLLAADRPQVPDPFARHLDERVATRFARVSPEPRRKRLSLARRAWMPALAGGLAAAVIAVVAVQSGGGGSSSSSTVPHLDSAPSLTPPTPHASAAATSSSAGSVKAAASTGAVKAAASAPVFNGPGIATSAAPAAPVPPSNGRKTTQSAQLQLLTAGSRIDAVAQEVYDVVGQENGIVRNSSVTAAAGNSGFASFSLSIPSANLAQTMTRLTQQRYVRVQSSTNSTQDVNGAYLAHQRTLQDARALRTSLLKQLADATTQTQVTSLNAQIHDAEASISSDEATLRGLEGRISMSPLEVQVNTGPLPGPVPVTGSSSGGFTLGRAAHDAVRVLTVAAGVALIALAAALPVALLVALGLWVAASVRRRRREQALDTA